MDIGATSLNIGSLENTGAGCTKFRSTSSLDCTEPHWCHTGAPLGPEFYWY